MKIFFNFIFTALFLVLLFVGVIPSLLSTEWGKETFIQSFNYLSKSSLKIEGLHVSWMGPQRIENIEWKDSRGDVRFLCPKIATEAPLSRIVFQHDIGHMTLEAPQITLVAKARSERPLPPLEQVGLSFAVAKEGIPPQGPILAYHPLFKLGLFDWIKYCGQLDLEQGTVTFLSEKLPPLKFDKLDLYLSRLHKDELHIQTACQIVEKDFAGTFTMAGAVTDIGTSRQDIALESKLLNFPIRSVDQIAAVFQPQLEGFFISLIGEALSADLKLKSSAETLSIDIDATSSQFSAYARTQASGTDISLHAPALFTWSLSPEVLDKLTGIKTTEDVRALLKINRFSLPIGNQQAFSFQAELSTSPLVLPNMRVEPMRLSLSTENFQEGIFIGSLSSPQVSCPEVVFSWKEDLKLLKTAQLTGTITGTLSTLDIPRKWENLMIDADVELQLKEPLSATLYCRSIQDISLILKNRHFDTTILGKLDRKENVFIIKDQVDFIYHLEELPQDFPQLTAPADIHVQLDPCALPLSDIYKLSLKGKGSAKEIPFKDYPVKDLLFSFQGNGQHQTLELQAEGGLGDGSFQLQIDAKNKLPETLIHLRATGDQLPSDFMSLFLPAHIKTTNLLGKTLTFTFDGTSSPKDQIVALKADSENFTCDLAFKQEQDIIQLLRPGKASFKLTKENYAELEKWSGSSPFEITEGTTLQLNLSELTLPATLSSNRIPSPIYDLQKIQLQGDGFIDKLSFLHKESQEATTLNHLKIHFSQPSKKSPLSFQISSSAQPQGILSIQGQFDHITQSTSLNGSVQQFPTALFDIFTHSAFSLNTLFGPTVNMTAMAKIQNNSGQVKLSLHSPHTRASIDGLLTDGVLTLNDTIYAQITLTPEIAKLLLKDINPLSSSAIEAGSPLTLEIGQDNFSLPLIPFSLKDGVIPHMKIELGKIFCENKGNLSDLMGILKLTGVSKEKRLETWFSPINISLEHGLITCERTDILLADAYQICTWGTIDLVNDDVNLTLGLTADCLKKAFKIKNLPNTYVLQIPMTGSLNDVHVNTALATTKVATLLLWQQKAAAGAIAGGPAGALLGDFLNKIGPIPDQNEKAPPAHHPLPWEETQGHLSHAAEAPSESPKKKKHFKPKENPLKQVLKMVR
jgi:hypothetical protein